MTRTNSYLVNPPPSESIPQSPHIRVLIDSPDQLSAHSGNQLHSPASHCQTPSFLSRLFLNRRLLHILGFIALQLAAILGILLGLAQPASDPSSTNAAPPSPAGSHSPSPTSTPTSTPDALPPKALELLKDPASNYLRYDALPGHDRQLHFLSDTPIETIHGQSNQISGSCILNPPLLRQAATLAQQSSNDPKSSAQVLGRWRLPVTSMRTGITSRDEHIAEPEWLDADRFPDVVFELASVRDVRFAPQPDAQNSAKPDADKSPEPVSPASPPEDRFLCTLEGSMTIKGVTKTITIPDALLALTPESPATRTIAPGDLLGIKADFSITLSDYNITHRVIGKKVAEKLDLNITLYCATTSNADSPTELPKP